MNTLKRGMNILTVGCSLAASTGPCPAGAPANPAPTRETVVLLHALGRTPRSMAWLGRQLKQRGYTVVNLGYPSRRGTIEELAGHVRKDLERDGLMTNSRVHFVTHSMGGIVLRACLQHARPHNLGRVVMLAPPNQGSEVVDRVRRIAVLRYALSPAGQQLGTGPDSAPNTLGPVDFELGVIAGSRSLNPLFSAWLPGPDDGKVSVQRTRVDGMKDFVVVPHSHTYMVWRQSVARQVAHFLAHGRFEPKPSPDAGAAGAGPTSSIQ